MIHHDPGFRDRAQPIFPRPPMQPSHRHDASRALERVRAALALGHGSVKRIDENRELLELLLTDAPGVLCRHPWVT